MKIKIDDTVEDIVVKMSEGNPGAMQALVTILEEDKIEYLYLLDRLNIYGTRLYILWNDHGHRDTSELFKYLDLYRQGEITKEDIDNIIGSGGYGFTRKQ